VRRRGDFAAARAHLVITPNEAGWELLARAEHVSHILRKLDAPTRLEAAAIAHRLAADR
jgi:hypothetical protein